MPKTEIEVEKLLQWAYRDELSKKNTSAAEGIWDRIQENQHHGGIDRGHGAAQRYAHFGLPDPDAERVERAVSALEDVVIDWSQSIGAIAGDLGALISINDLTPAKSGRKPNAGWGKAGDRALRGYFGPGSERPVRDRPRDVLMVGGIRINVLVAMHAAKGTRPDWREEQPQPHRIEAERGVNAKIIGECRGKNLYTAGSYCPLKWIPSPTTIVTSRADYAAWHLGLVWLSEQMQLEKFAVLPPKASPTPWLYDDEEDANLIPVVPTGSNSVEAWGTLPLAPTREKVGSPLRRSKAGPVRYPLEGAS